MKEIFWMKNHLYCTANGEYREDENYISGIAFIALTGTVLFKFLRFLENII